MTLHKSTKEEIEEVNEMIDDTQERIEKLLKRGKQVHIIWDFDGVLASSRSDDVFEVSNYDLDAYFAHEHRMLLDAPEWGPWFSLAPKVGRHKPGLNWPDFTQVTQDIVTARSSVPAMRVQILCMSLETRWMLFVGHQSKGGSYRIILDSLRNNSDTHIFCIDDKAKCIDTFKEVSEDMNMKDRCHGIVSPVVREYTEEELREYLNRVMSVERDKPIMVRDPVDDALKFVVLPKGVEQFNSVLSDVTREAHSEANDQALRSAFVKSFGEPGEGYFDTEEELRQAMRNFILSLPMNSP